MRCVLPTAISIGGQRCASTSLHRLLANISGIFWEGEKDSLGKILAKEGVSGVSAVYRDGSESLIRGEKTPTYSAMYECEVREIARLIPDLKIIFTIRNPVDRCWSSVTRVWTYAHLEGQPQGPGTDRQILAILDRGLCRRLTDYERTLKIWMGCFPRSQILINTIDELRFDSSGFYNRILEFLGIPEDERAFPDPERKNVSKVEQPIDPYHRYFLARRWLPMLKRLEQRIPEKKDVSVWRDELERIISEGDPRWRAKCRSDLIFRDVIHHSIYRPVSYCRGLRRGLAMRRQVSLHLKEY